MKFTNTHNLPEAVYRALIKNDYSAGESDYSATTLIKSPRMVQLGRRYMSQMECDAMDRVWSVLGTAVHKVFEEHTEDEAVAEVRMYMDVAGRKIGGALDHFRDGLVSDYKCTSVWSWIYGSRIKEWTEQLNIYADLYRENGYDVKGLRIVALFRDWKESELLKNPDQYPPQPIMCINLELWGAGKTLEYISGRVEQHKACEDMPDNELPRCTEQEMWAKPTKYAVMKNTNKRASRVFELSDLADEYVAHALTKAKKKDTFHIEVRPGGRTRCAKYCDASKFCDQYQAYLKELPC